MIMGDRLGALGKRPCQALFRGYSQIDLFHEPGKSPVEQQQQQQNENEYPAFDGGLTNGSLLCSLILLILFAIHPAQHLAGAFYHAG
ncbi:MAG: hypothetical protein M5U34_33505 [Chloroflexi bacterium]|nr:hypothetical protein [Chloroflexota bacterium]